MSKIIDKPVGQLGKQEWETVKKQAENTEYEQQETETEIRNVLNDVVNIIKKYVILPDYAGEAVSLYIISTWLFEVATFAPILLLKSPSMRCGKTTLMDLIGEMVRQPLSAVNASPAALFRAISAQHPTLLLDEVDTVLQQKNETSEAIRGIINAGHRKGRFSRVLRVSGTNFDVEEFDVFGFKVLSGIGKIHNTLADRSIIIPMRRKRLEEKIERLRIAKLEPVFEEIRDKIASQVELLTEKILDYEPEIPEKLSDRAADNWELLLAIADIAGEGWPELARQAALTLSGKDENASYGEILLDDIKNYFNENPHLTATSTVDLLEFLQELETRPWITWHRDKPMTPRDLAKQLEGYGIAPLKLSIHGKKVRGYKKEDFLDSWSRYLTPENEGTPVPQEANSLQDKELKGYHVEARYRNHPEPQKEPQEAKDTGTGCTRNPVPQRNHANSLQDKELRVNSTGVPDKLGVPAEEEGNLELDIF